MTLLEEKFARLSTDNAPGQEIRKARIDLSSQLLGDHLTGMAVDFSHGDVDAFKPCPSSLAAFVRGVQVGGKRAYTEYKGDAEIREELAVKLAGFTGAPLSASDSLIITPGTQGALFLAVASTVAVGDKVAIVRPDYFANQRLVEFFGGVIVPVTLDYLDRTGSAGLDLSSLESAFKVGAKVFVFSNPNNPTGTVYSADEIEAISRFAALRSESRFCRHFEL